MEKSPVDIQALKDTSPSNIQINWHKHHRSYIQSHLSETEGQPNLYIEHSIMTEAVPNELLRLITIVHFHEFSIETQYWNDSCTYTRSPMIFIHVKLARNVFEFNKKFKTISQAIPTKYFVGKIGINAQSIISIIDSSWVFLTHLISDMTRKFLGNYRESIGKSPYSLA